jgi:hypothetical protein
MRWIVVPKVYHKEDRGSREQREENNDFVSVSLLLSFLPFLLRERERESK